MKDIKDIRAGYRVPDGYFEDFSARMAQMAHNSLREKRIRFIRRMTIAVSSSAAVIVLAVVLFFNGFSVDVNKALASVPSDVLITKYFGATESEVIDYYYLPVEDNSSQSLTDDDILNYLSQSGSVNLFALMEY